MSQSASLPSVTLTDQGTLNFTMKVLDHTFHLIAHGYRCQTRDLYQVVLKAAAQRTTIEAVCHDAPAAPDSNTVRGHLHAHLAPTAIPQLEQDCNRALYRRWPHGLWSQPVEIALDLHDICYYGDYDTADPTCWVHKGRQRNGTRRFYRCATVSIVRQPLRLTLAVAFVHPAEDLVAVVQKLLKYVQLRGLRLGCLYADKGFCTVALLEHLRRHTRCAVIVAVPRKGDQHGVLSLCRGCRSYFTVHTFGRAGRRITVEVAVVRAYQPEHGKPRQATWLVYALIRVSDSLQHIRERYRGRFGIDTGYRSLEQVRARTCSPNPALRFFLIGVALVLVNVWLVLRGRLAAGVPRRLRQQPWRVLTLARLACFLTRAVESVYGVVKEVSPTNL